MNAYDVYEKKGTVLMVQTDHVSGEVIGTALQDFYDAGAFNVQVIPTVTKKNRPGHLFIVDCAPEDGDAMERVILDELGATGWHRLQTAHRHVGTEIIERQVTFDTPDGPYRLPLKIKVVKNRPDRLRPEHDGCLALREALRGRGVWLSLSQISCEVVRQVEMQMAEEKR